MDYLDVEGLGPVSRIGLGTWQFGSREWGYGDAYADRAARDIVRRARELGITLFDTAELYGFGRSERILGEALGHERGDIAFGVGDRPAYGREAHVRVGHDRAPFDQGYSAGIAAP